ncbi:uracil phosphoribosyltransferase [Estrella lausannensis]|uniref:Truncated uracil phosphoribosyltransferase n=1 Tax=Estrella lausannensis TaxID=483423 RepID=A0A0H5DR28_9BACT|nr:uracil phosphoribosyltransferase [Estrella lausannensis]CRX39126.1 Truncated uracil phosphoribosyltransferase [Estrella lausannensis]
MLTAKERFLTLLRDKHSDRATFRRAAIRITEILVFEAMQHLDWKKIEIDTPLETTPGVAPSRPTALIPILRSGLAMLPQFEAAFPDSKIGFLGFQRDEETFIPRLYYDRLPRISKETEVMLLDPMLATGGGCLPPAVPQTTP